MNGITDHPFRHIQKKYGKPMLLYTEFTGVERLAIGDRDLLKDFLYDESQRPIIGQIFGNSPPLFRRMAVLLCQLGFDGIDINMGCPSPSVVHRGSGAGLINTPDLALAIVQAVKDGVEDWRNGMTLRDLRGVPQPVIAEVEARQQRLPPTYQQRRAIPISVKTRIGYERPLVREWIPRLLESEPAAIALHGRTLRQGYSGQADWDAIALAAEIAHATPTLLLGNGDVESLADAHRRIAACGTDGVLIGRASYGNPFVFRQEGDHHARLKDREGLLRIALEHAHLYEACLGQNEGYRFLPMRKHLSWYVRGVPSASHLRRELIQSWSVAEVEAILARYAQHRPAFRPPA
jgi:nifR3 family TIM-barrel protein